MTFEAYLNEWPETLVQEQYATLSERQVEAALSADRRTPENLLALLSPAALPFLEAMAQEANKQTRRQFGRTVSLYAPIYLSNVCGSNCLYCSFSTVNAGKETRTTLTPTQIEDECRTLAKEGFSSVLLLTGDAVHAAPPEYIAQACTIARRWFSSVAVEVYSMTQEEYHLLCTHGLDGVTLYQETYHKPTYLDMHRSGRKRDFSFRLEALERAANAGVRRLGAGVLLGLYKWRVDAFWLALHARWLQTRCWNSTIALSFPRLKHTPSAFNPPFPVSDINMVQMILALRLFLPESPFYLSTREAPSFRDKLLPLGITAMSAGSSTRPGGYAAPTSPTLEQFQIEDVRTVSEIKAFIEKSGYDPVWKDYDQAFTEAVPKQLQ